jgi:hypothetical protein
MAAREIFQTERIPLVGMPNQRQATDGTAVTKDQRFINFFPMKYTNKLTGKETYYLVKRPGFETFLTPTAGSIGTALHVWETVGTAETDIMSAWGAVNSTIKKGTTSLGAMTGVAKGFTEIDFTGTSTVVIPSSDNTAWYYPFGGALTQITDADFPTARGIQGKFVSLDGYLFIMDQFGRIYNSDINSVTAWGATSFIETTYYTGFGIGLARHHDAIVAFTSSAVEFYTNEGASPSPLARREMVTVPIGCVRPTNTYYSSIAQMREQLFFIGTQKTGGASIYKIEQYAFHKVSIPAIDQQLEVAEPNNCYLTNAKIWGMDVIILGAGTISYVYLPDFDMWCEIDGSADVWEVLAGGSANQCRVFSLSSSDTSGKIYQWNTDTPVWTDNGVAYTASAITSRVDFDTENNKRFHKVKLIGDKQASTCTIGISWSDDDYVTFSTERNVDMSQDRTYLTQCGMGRRRAFKFTNSTNTPCRLQALELNYSECGF